MKVIVAVIVCVAFVAGLPSKTRHFPRRYFPEEDNPNRQAFLFVADKQGKVRLEDLRRHEPRSTASSSDVTFYLYTKDNPQEPEVIGGSNFEDLFKSQYFNANRKTKFTIHGWTGEASDEINVSIKEALFEQHNVNIFVVDWSGVASKFYTTSRNAVPNLGRVVGDFINFIIENYENTPEDFCLAGFSLGAHIAGSAGATVKAKHGLVDFIVGLDPAGPMFTVEDTEGRLDAGDAQHVQVIHTNGGFLGFKSAIGQADYFPNGGSNQPGCGLDLFGTCAHNRAVKFFTESIRSSGFTSHLCLSLSDYDKGHCSGNEESWMGEYHVDREAEGDFFLRTSNKVPFALG